MRATPKKLVAVLATAGLLALTAACGGDSGGSGGGGDTQEVEVFTWWAEGSEKEGLDALVKVFEDQHPDFTFVNGAVAGGAGSDAKNVLASRLQTNDPPATFQAHAGAELTDYIEQGQIEGLSDMYEEKGWNELFPEGLLERLQQDGEIYSVPSHIHRANVVWANPAVLEEAGLDPEATYDTLDDWIAALEKVDAAGKIPLSVATDWTQVHLLETVLLADLGAEAYNGLWDGSTDWGGPEVKAALEDYAKLMSFTNSDRQSLDWPDATQLVIDGDAAFNVMGDWAEAAFASQDKKFGEDYITFPVPGTDGVFDFLADSFTMPVNGPNPEGTEAWLDTVAIESWENDEIVSSLAHGAAASVSWLTDITAAVAKFGSDEDVAGLQEGLVAAAEKNAQS